MILSALKETNKYEKRVAITPESVKLFKRLNIEMTKK